MKIVTLLSTWLFIGMVSLAQSSQTEDPAAAYTRVITQRAAKIVAQLDINDPTKAEQVQAIIVQQYRDLNETHDGSKAKIKALADQPGEGNKSNEQAVKEIEAATDKQLKQLHNAFLKKLSAHLTEKQIDKVKDEMTYRVFHVTYTAYQDMIPTLTENQKSKIYEWLKEARELAMDEGSSEDKHKVFGKYKGRINNYLSSEGYDLKKEEKAWQERLREKRKQAQSTN